ncbi:MAG: tetratricopeptide repeat protein [Sedimentisphaerales bacterium]|jgi:tetratricopeptide (TPR) repeat protein
MPNGDIQAKKMDVSRTALICVVLAAVTFVAFEGVKNNGFVNYDDNVYVTENPSVQGGLNLKSIQWAFTSLYAGNWHPMTWISHAIDCAVFGPDPAGHHLVSVVLHIANVILLFLILKKITGAIWPSAFVAAVFGLHPLGVESVAWVAERKNVLSTFFAFLTIAAYLRYTQKPGLRRYVMVAVCFAAGLLAKPMLVTLPFVLILLDYWPIGRFAAATGLMWLRREFVEKAPLVAMSAASCAVTYLAQARSEGLLDIAAAPLSLRLGNAAVSYVGYIGKVFYPAALAILYPLDLNGLKLWQMAASFASVLIISLAVITAGRRRRYLLTGWFWYLGTLVPVIGLVQVGLQSMADRYTYLPGIGIYIIIVWLAGDVITKFRLPKSVVAPAGVMVLAALLLITRAQVGYWKDSLTLCEHTLAITKNNYVIQSNCGDSLRMAGRLDEAIAHYRQAIEINPGYAIAHNNLGLVLSDKGLLPEATAEFKLATEIMPNYVKALNSYGAVLAMQGQLDQAISKFARSLSIMPYYKVAMDNMCHAGVDGNMPDAVLDVIISLQQKAPDYADLYYRAGVIYDAKGDFGEATKQFVKAFALANRQGNKDLMERTGRRLDAYRQRKVDK